MARYSKHPTPPATISEALNAETADKLKQYLKLLRDRKGTPTRKAELLSEICAYLKGSKLEAVWDKLDDISKAAVAEATHDPIGEFHSRQFNAKYGESPTWTTSGNRSYQSSPALVSVLFHNRYIPDDLRAELKSFVPKPIDTSLNTCESLPANYSNENMRGSREAEETPLDIHDMELAARHDLRAVLGLIEAGKLSVSEKTRLPSAVTCKALNTILLRGDFYDDDKLEADGTYIFYEHIGPIRSFAWPMLLQAAGVSETIGKRLHLSKIGRRALSDPPEKTLRQLWRRWVKTTLFDEYRRVDAIKGQTGKGKRGFTSLAGRRQAIEIALTECPVGSWVSVDELLRYMQATGNDFEVTQDPWSLYICDKQYGSLGYDGYHNWEILQGRYAMCLLFEYAATLGLIDVACVTPHFARSDFADMWGTDDLLFLSRYDGFQYLRLTPLGAYCLGLTEQYVATEPEQRDVLRVLPNLDIVGIGEGLDAGDRLLLDSFSIHSSDSVWQLNQAKLLTASEQGRDLNEFRKFLLARSAEPLPETVERLLNDALERATLLQDKGSVRLIECADAPLAALIANDSRCKKLCLLAGDRHLIVYAGYESRFRNEVRKLGYSLPAN